MDIATLLFNGLAVIGGSSGIVSAYKWIRNKKARLKILSAGGSYYMHQGELIAVINLILNNEKDEAIYVTDLLGMLREDPSKTKTKKGSSFALRPTNPNFSPFEIGAKSTIPYKFEITFPSIELKPINRMGVASLMGFLENGIPMLVAKESDFDEKWDELPLEMKLVMHVNGKDVLARSVALFPNYDDSGGHGTLTGIQITQLQREFMQIKNKYST